MLAGIPFHTTHWATVEPTLHPGESGMATWRTLQLHDVRVRMVEYSPGYVADHWCERGHVLLVLEGELITELRDGRVVALRPGQSYQVGDGDEAHRSRSPAGARLFVVDRATPPRAERAKTIGLLGGMSWESTLHYYRLVNEGVRSRLGGHSSAPILLYSVDFDPIVRMQAEGRWDEAGEALVDAALRLERGGADFLVLCTNTMHKVADVIASRVALPLLHVVDPTAAAIVARGLRTVGLLGTRFTMEEAFYRDRLADKHGLAVVVPEAADRDVVHRVIYDELCHGEIVPSSRAELRRIVAAMADRGAEGVILGCTELMMLLGREDLGVPVFDTTALHAAAAVSRALDT